MNKHTRWIVCSALSMALAISAAAQMKNSCLDCHSALDAPLHVTADQFSQDIHAQKGLTCANCHGGNPASDDDAMNPKAGFKGKITRAQVPAVCGSCHSDASYMRQYNPSLRTDQAAQYKTSQHGKLLAKGDTNVAVCTDCHSVHDLRPASDPRSNVHPLNVANTCSRCHSNRDHMKAYKISTEQFAGYSGSVHHDALTVRGDLSAPTCTTCHGNHGAAPPGVASVGNVCSTCHAFQAQLFDKSPHKAAFENAGMASCVTCHSNHRIQHPSDVMLGAGAQSVCTNCHSSGDAGFAVAVDLQNRLKILADAMARSNEVLDRAERSGMEISQAKLELEQANDALTKARVSIHSFSISGVEENTSAGMKIAVKSYEAGLTALRERDHRRLGLGISLITVLATVIGLRLFIREVES